MGGAQPLAATMNGAVALVIEVDPQRIARRLATRYLDEATENLDTALDRCARWTREGVARSIGLCANAADVLPALVARGVTPDVLTDQTSAHDALNGYVPNGMSLGDAVRLRSARPTEYIERSMSAMAEHVRAMLALRARGAASRSITARQQHPCAGRNMRASRTRSTFRGSSRSTSGLSFAKAKDRSDGPHCLATRKIFA